MEKKITHFSHNHELEMVDLEEVRSRYGENVVCYGCENSATGLTYCCRECEVFLHKSCAELPGEIDHVKHEHKLKLRKLEDQMVYCDLCYRLWEGFTYYCEGCDYDLDVFCSQWESRTVSHPGHLHRLTLHTKRVLLECDACRTRKEDQFYDCTKCSFAIHRTCAEREAEFSSKSHEHQLRLAYGVPREFLFFRLACGNCKKSLHRSEWSYYCSDCWYFIHLNCAKSTKDEPKDTSEAEQVPPGTVILPVAEVSSVLVANFMKEYVRQENELTQASNDHLTHPSHDPLTQPSNDHLTQPSSDPLTHPSCDPLTQPSNDPLTHPSHDHLTHPSHCHPLTLTNKEDNYSKMFKDDQDTVCNACVEHISGLCYTCGTCKYFIHVHCTQLPKEISHDHIHEHKLSLTFPRECFSLELCQACQRYSNGFFYKCEACHLSLDIKCALFPPQVKHHAHEHLLVQATSGSGRCNACRKMIFDAHFVKCYKHRDFNLHIKCALLPEKVFHRWDAHPLILKFPPFHNLPDEIICIICEEEIDLECWLYHCEEKCGNFFHTECLPRIAEQYNVKLGSTLKDFHKHPLTFVRRAKYKSNCQACKEDLRNRLVFECEHCMDSRCHECVRTFADAESSSLNWKKM